jgi:hypothetical protein
MAVLAVGRGSEAATGACAGLGVGVGCEVGARLGAVIGAPTGTEAVVAGGFGALSVFWAGGPADSMGIAGAVDAAAGSAVFVAAAACFAGAAVTGGVRFGATTCCVEGSVVVGAAASGLAETKNTAWHWPPPVCQKRRNDRPFCTSCR